jgi:acyl transferase domain-containing protein
MDQPYEIGTPDDHDGAEPIAIVGIAARVPGANDVHQFWRNLVDGVESVTTFTREEQLARGAQEGEVDDPGWVNAAPVVDGFDQLDAGLFGMSDREAALTNPQHRLFLESCYTVLQDAGYDPARYPGAIGVYAGSGGNAYFWENIRHNAAASGSPHNAVSLATGNQPNYVATGPSYRLNLRGPSMTVATACSTSLVALHLACEALRNGECDMAIAGGVNLEHPQGVGYLGMEGFTSPDAHVRPFDAAANGTVWGSGVGTVLVKRLSDAIADGDTIRAVVLGNAINNDGGNKVGFTAPASTARQKPSPPPSPWPPSTPARSPTSRPTAPAPPWATPSRSPPCPWSTARAPTNASGAASARSRPTSATSPSPRASSASSRPSSRSNTA